MMKKDVDENIQEELGEGNIDKPFVGIFERLKNLVWLVIGSIGIGIIIGMLIKPCS